jgi:hypothetical protein
LIAGEKGGVDGAERAFDAGDVTVPGGGGMEEAKRRISMVRLLLELIEQSIVLVFLELKLAVLEVKHNFLSAKNGAGVLAMGVFLLLFALTTMITTAIAALSIVLPVWLSSLIVTVVLGFFGIAFLLTGLGKLKDFTVIPTETVERVEDIARKLRTHAELHQKELRREK